MSINRRQFNQFLLAGAAGLAFGAAGPQVAGAASETPVRGGTLNWAYYPDPSALIAINTSSGTGQAIGPKINEGLFDFDYDLNPIPLLATEWSVSEDQLRLYVQAARGGQMA